MEGEVIVSKKLLLDREIQGACLLSSCCDRLTRKWVVLKSWAFAVVVNY